MMYAIYGGSQTYRYMAVPEVFTVILWFFHSKLSFFSQTPTHFFIHNNFAAFLPLISEFAYFSCPMIASSKKNCFTNFRAFEFFFFFFLSLTLSFSLPLSFICKAKKFTTGIISLFVILVFF